MLRDLGSTDKGSLLTGANLDRLHDNGGKLQLHLLAVLILCLKGDEAICNPAKCQDIGPYPFRQPVNKNLSVSCNNIIKKQVPTDARYLYTGAVPILSSNVQ